MNFLTKCVAGLFLSLFSICFLGCETTEESHVSDNSVNLLMEAPRVVTSNDNGKIITRKLQQQFMVELPGNPTTGYSWRVKAYDKGILKLVSRRYDRTSNRMQGIASSAQTTRIGQGGVFMFSFKSIAAGKTTLEFVYTRPWEKNQKVSEADQFNIEVEVLAPSN